MAGMDLKTELKQVQHLSPQMLQSNRILQMDLQELQDFVTQAVENNPVLEKESPAELSREAVPVFRRNTGRSEITGGENAPGEIAFCNPRELTLEEFLTDQLERKMLPEPLEKLCLYLVECLDGSGYLDGEELHSLRQNGISGELLEQALVVLQSLEPAGIAARSLEECLLLQLQRQPEPDPLVCEIAAHHLDALSRHRWREIARETHTTEEAVHRAAKIIQSLSPRPGYPREEQEQPVYVIPDILLKKNGPEPELILNESCIPRVFISEYYHELYRTAEDEETRDFLREHMQQARWIINGLQRRCDTLLSCAGIILKTQKEFLLGHTPYVVPMTQKQAAAEIGVHESTLGRCIRGKYLQCDSGTFPMQYFFSRPVTEGGHSEQALRIAIQEILRTEDPHRPYSDRKIADILAARGISAARRTVTKYRLALKIPAASERKA